MEKKRSILKIIATLFFAVAIFGAYFYVIFGKFTDTFKSEYLVLGAIGACFLFALCFIKKDVRTILLTISLALTAGASYFLIMKPFDNSDLIGMSIMAGAQLLLVIYTLCINKSVGTRIVNLAFRVAICLVAYFVMQSHFDMGLNLLQIIALMYILNFFATLLVLLLHIKTEGWTLLGLFIFFAGNVFVGFNNGALDLLNITGDFVEFVNNYKDVAFWCCIPGLYFTALSSVWKAKKQG